MLVGNSARIALPVLQAVRSFGDETCFLAGSKETAALRWSRLCTRHVLIDFDDDERSVRRINDLAAKAPQAMLIPFDCEGIRLVNRVGGRLALSSIPVPDLPTLEMFDDKWRFYHFCVANGLPAPATRWIGSKENLDFSALEAQLGLPFVIKPTNCSGSLGVQIVGSQEIFEEEILLNPRYQHEPLIAQRYVDGMDMDINLLSVHGRLGALSIHRIEGSWMDFVPHTQLEEMAERLCRASGYHGVMNVDVRLDKRTGEVFLVESNPRFWASLVAAVGCGLNFVAESVKPPGPQERPRRLTSGRFHTRHPLLRPSAWRPLFSDSGETGRLLRARLFDPYSLGQLAREMPGMASRFLDRSKVPLRPLATP
ncbi:ATP-grasp domain-containing protein [Caenimonas soli]|uniref:ATP-grasp domain-containing protein n=1 Tax=Caenimonas soli TaxID=2735555 RepID=UPI002E2B8183|nr:ATP-grasp domain-containing protein [Caenimonas soli]